MFIFLYLYKSPLVPMNRSKTSFTYMDRTPEPSLHPASLHSVDTASCGKIPHMSISLSMTKVVAIPYVKEFSL